MSSIDQMVRGFQVLPDANGQIDPQRQLPVKPAGGRLELTRRPVRQSDQTGVAGVESVAITPHGANQYNGNQQIGQETVGGADGIGVSVPADADYGVINAWRYHDWEVVMANAAQAFTFTIDGADEALGVVNRPNSFVARAFWIHVTFQMKGAAPTFPADVYYLDGEAPDIDASAALYEATFLVKQLGVGQPLRVTFWSGPGSYSQAAAPAPGGGA